MTKLLPIHVERELKKVLELHKSLKGFSSVGDALKDLLKESDKYKKLLNILSGYSEPKEIDINKLEIEDLI